MTRIDFIKKIDRLVVEFLGRADFEVTPNDRMIDMKDCRTCKNTTDQYFCELLLRPDVKEWSDKHIGNYDDFTDDCPGYNNFSNRQKDNNEVIKVNQKNLPCDRCGIEITNANSYMVVEITIVDTVGSFKPVTEQHIWCNRCVVALHKFRRGE